MTITLREAERRMDWLGDEVAARIPRGEYLADIRRIEEAVKATAQQLDRRLEAIESRQKVQAAALMTFALSTVGGLFFFILQQVAGGN